MASLNAILAQAAKAKPATPVYAQPGAQSGGGAGSGGEIGSPYNLDVQNKFVDAANGGAFGPVTLEQLFNSDAFKNAGAGNNTQAYDAAYQNAVAGARSNITQGLGAALTELTNRENAVNAEAAAAPGQINQLYGAATGAVNSNAGVLQGQLTGAQVDPAIGGSSAAQMAAPAQQAIAANQAAQLTDVAPMQAGLQGMIGEQKAQDQLSAGQQLAQLDMQAADTAYSHAQQSQSLSPLQQAMVSDFQDKQSAKASSAADSQKQTATANAFSQHVDSLGTGPDQGKALINNTVNPAYASQLRTTPEYKAANTSLSSAQATITSQIAAAKAAAQKKADKTGVKSTFNPASVAVPILQKTIKQYAKKYPGQSHALSIAAYDLGFTKAQWAQVAGG